MNQAHQPTLWFVSDRSRYFLIPGDVECSTGDAVIIDLTGQLRYVDITALTSFEVTDDQARLWAKDQLGQTLEELKHGIDERLADLRRQLDERNRTPVTENSTLTPNAVPALFKLLKTLPGVIGNSLSGEENRVKSAKTAMASFKRQLKEAGIDLDDRFTKFSDRLADLRKERPPKPD